MSEHLRSTKIYRSQIAVEEQVVLSPGVGVTEEMPGSITIGRNAYNAGWRGGRKMWAVNAERRFNTSGIRYGFMDASSLNEITARLRTSQTDVFLSHKQQDIDQALRLAEILSDLHNLNVYLDVTDPNVDPDDRELDDYLRAVIRNSNSLLVLVSEKTKDSWWVPFEVGVASERGKLIGTFLGERVPLPSFLDRWTVIPKDASLDRWANSVKARSLTRALR